MFAAFTSRCTKSCSWMYASPAHSCAASAHASARVKPLAKAVRAQPVAIACRGSTCGGMSHARRAAAIATQLPRLLQIAVAAFRDEAEHGVAERDKERMAQQQHVRAAAQLRQRTPFHWQAVGAAFGGPCVHKLCARAPCQVEGRQG